MNYIIIWLILIKTVYSKLFCPPYCECHMQDEFRYVGCVNKGLISIELDVPSSVQWLQLSNNSIHTLYDNAFYNFNLVLIEKLDLNRNGINTIQKNAFYGMSRLVSLDLSYNHLYTLDPSTFERTKNLLQLDLSSNPLRVLSEPFLISSSLQMLYIRSCNLGYIKRQSLSEMPNLREVDLSNNQLLKLDSFVLENKNRLKEINLSGNFLTCNEDTTNLMKNLHEKGIKLYGVDCSSLGIFEPLSNDVKLPALKKDEKFQRMVVESTTTIKSTQPPFDDDSKEDTVTQIKIFEKTNIYQPIDIQKNSYNNLLLLFIIFFSGFAIGVFLAFTSVAMFSLYRRCQKRHGELNRLDTEMSRMQQNLLQNNSAFIQPLVFSSEASAPPPNYSQLFGTNPHIASR